MAALRRSRRIRLRDVPRVAIRAASELGALFGGRYRRSEGAHLLVTDDAGRLLVVRPTYLADEWMLPGGRVERDERPAAAATRETREETGIETEAGRLVAVDTSRRGTTGFIYAGRATGGTLNPQLGEIAEAGWVGREEIAATSPKLERILAAIDAADGVAELKGRSRDAA